MWDVIVSILTVIEVLTALLLIGIILIQQSKSGGGLGAMGGAVTETFFGPASGNVMTKITVYLAGIFLGLTLVLAIITGHRKPGRSVVEAYEPDEKPVAEEVVTTEKAADAPASESEATDEAPAADADADADADAKAEAEEGAAAGTAAEKDVVEETTEKAAPKAAPPAAKPE